MSNKECYVEFASNTYGKSAVSAPVATLRNHAQFAIEARCPIPMATLSQSMRNKLAKRLEKVAH